MKLTPKIKYDQELQIGDKTIKFRKWTTKNERDYIKLITNKEDYTELDLYNCLIEPTLEDPSINLSIPEQKYLLLNIRILSRGDLFKDTIVCKNCGHKEEKDIKISEIMRFNINQYKEIINKTEDDIKLEIGPISKNKKRLYESNNLIDYVFYDFLLHIKSVEINGELFTPSFNELMEYIDSLSSNVFDEIFEEFQNMVDSVDLEYTFKCSECKEENKKYYLDIPNLLWV